MHGSFESNISVESSLELFHCLSRGSSAVRRLLTYTSNLELFVTSLNDAGSLFWCAQYLRSQSSLALYSLIWSCDESHAIRIERGGAMPIEGVYDR